MSPFRSPREQAFLTLALAATLLACRSGLHCFTSARGFSSADLEGQRVLLLPVAVTDELGDDRTGIVLDRSSRHDAARLACRSAPDIRKDIPIVCFDDPAIAASSAAQREVYTQFARDVPITPEHWRAVGRATGTRFALLFRPEDVRASQTVTRPLRGPPWDDGPVAQVPKSWVTTTRTYTLRCDLVDLRTGQVVRTAIRSSSGSTSTPEPPEASSHLHGIMRDLMSEMLD